jgi:hypothetical protein
VIIPKLYVIPFSKSSFLRITLILHLLKLHVKCNYTDLYNYLLGNKRSHGALHIKYFKASQLNAPAELWVRAKIEMENFMKTATILCTIFIALSTIGCGEQAEVRGAEFPTLSRCLEGIKKNTGSSLEIYTDTPEKVSGVLSNGQTFSCEMKSTGTKGVYFEGWYMVK